MLYPDVYNNMNTYGRHSAANSNDFVEDDFVKKANSSDVNISTSGNEISLSHRGTKRVRIDADGVEVDNLTAASASLPQYVPKSDRNFLRSGGSVAIGTTGDDPVELRQRGLTVMSLTGGGQDRVHIFRQLVHGSQSDFDPYTKQSDLAPLNEAVLENPLGLDPTSEVVTPVEWDPNVKSDNITIDGNSLQKSADNELAWVYSETEIHPHRYDYVIRLYVDEKNSGGRLVFGFNEVKQNFSRKMTTYNASYPNLWNTPSLGAGVWGSVLPTAAFIRTSYNYDDIISWDSASALTIAVREYLDFVIIDNRLARIMYSASSDDILETVYGAPSLELGECPLHLFLCDQISHGNSAWKVTVSIQSQVLRALKVSDVLKAEYKIFQDALYGSRIQRHDAYSYMVVLPGTASRTGIAAAYLPTDTYFMPAPVQIGQRLSLKNIANRDLYLTDLDLNQWKVLRRNSPNIELISTTLTEWDIWAGHSNPPLSFETTNIPNNGELGGFLTQYGHEVDLPYKDDIYMMVLNTTAMNLTSYKISINAIVYANGIVKGSFTELVQAGLIGNLNRSMVYKNEADNTKITVEMQIVSSDPNHVTGAHDSDVLSYVLQVVQV